MLAALPLTRMTTDHRDERRACCPSCGRKTTFSLAGVQRWPKHIAALTGTPEAINLWNCGACHSTISETAFKE